MCRETGVQITRTVELGVGENSWKVTHQIKNSSDRQLLSVFDDFYSVIITYSHSDRTNLSGIPAPFKKGRQLYHQEKRFNRLNPDCQINRIGLIK